MLSRHVRRAEVGSYRRTVGEDAERGKIDAIQLAVPAQRQLKPTSPVSTPRSPSLSHA